MQFPIKSHREVQNAWRITFLFSPRKNFQIGITNIVFIINHNNNMLHKHS